MEITYISARIHESNKIKTATPNFPGSGNTDRLLGILCYVWVYRKSKMAANNRKWIRNYVYISAYKLYDSNEIPTATPMFPRGSSKTDRLLGTYVWACRQSKMAAIHRK